MNSLGWFLMIFILIGIVSCNIGLQKETDRTTRIKCFEQTKNDKCWDLK